jgi:hypothetical protein
MIINIDKAWILGVRYLMKRLNISFGGEVPNEDVFWILFGRMKSSMFGEI